MFTGGGIDALAPDADGSGGYAALSALPVFFGTEREAPFGPGVFTGGGIGALSNYDALSAIPAYLNICTRDEAAPLAASTVAPQTKLVQDPPTTTPPTGSNPVTDVRGLASEAQRLHTACTTGVHPAGTSEGGPEGRGGGDSGGQQ